METHFTFHHKSNPHMLYTAQSQPEYKSYIVMWNDDGKMRCYTYRDFEVETNLRNKTWLKSHDDKSISDSIMESYN